MPLAGIAGRFETAAALGPLARRDSAALVTPGARLSALAAREGVPLSAFASSTPPALPPHHQPRLEEQQPEQPQQHRRPDIPRAAPSRAPPASTTPELFDATQAPNRADANTEPASPRRPDPDDFVQPDVSADLYCEDGPHLEA